jgi:predicted acetyltransferase
MRGGQKMCEFVKILNNLELIKLSKNYKNQYLKFVENNAHDLKETGFYFRFPLSSGDTFEEDVRILENRVEGIDIPEWEVPNSTYFLYDKNQDKILGGVNIRHELYKRYLIDGGHIGYYIGLSERRNGYGKHILKMALKFCRSKGIQKVLVTCVKPNIASAKVILSNGGVFEKEIETGFKGENEIFMRYWIEL